MTSAQTPPTSSLHVSQQKPREIAEWHYTSSALAGKQAQTQRHLVKVSMAPPAVDGTIAFIARCPELGVEAEALDLNTLKERIRALLDDVVTVRDGATWEPWLEVKVGLVLFRHSEARSRQLSVAYNGLLRGTHPAHPGEAFTVSSNGSVVPFPKPLTPDGPRQDVDVFARPPAADARTLSDQLNAMDRRERDMTYAYLPDTPDNRAALDRIIQAMDDLTQRLHALLSPEQVALSLQAIASGLPLLGLDHAP